jgi:myosin heavy subunit
LIHFTLDLLQCDRVVNVRKGERSFHVFYYLLAACTSNKDEKSMLNVTTSNVAEFCGKFTTCMSTEFYFLFEEKYYIKTPDKYHYLSQSDCYTIENEDTLAEWNRLQNAFTSLRIDESTKANIFKLLSAILHLGNIEFKVSKKKGSKVTSSSSEGSKHNIKYHF